MQRDRLIPADSRQIQRRCGSSAASAARSCGLDVAKIKTHVPPLVLLQPAASLKRSRLVSTREGVHDLLRTEESPPGHRSVCSSGVSLSAAVRGRESCVTSQVV